MSGSETFFKKERVDFLILFFSSVLNAALGVVISYYATRLLGVADFGFYSFVNSSIAMGCVLLTFGFFYSGSRILLIGGGDFNPRIFFGVTIYLVFIIAVAISFCIFLFLNLTTDDSRVSNFLFLMVCFLGVSVFLITQFFETILPAGGFLKLIAKSRVYPKILFILAAVFFYYSIERVDVRVFLVVNYLIFIFVLMVLIAELRPLFAHQSAFQKNYFDMNKKYGFDIYVGSIFTVGGTASSGVFVGLLGSDLTEVGYYFLATSLCAPLLLVSTSICGAYLRRFSILEQIPMNLIFVLIGLIVTPAVIMFFIVDVVVVMLWGDAYISVSEFVRVLLVGSVLYGVGDVFKQFLVAKGESKKLRDGSFLVGITLVSLTIALVSYFGGLGAALARGGAGLVYLFLMVFYYKKISVL